jgi:hypothetical protein
MAGWTAWISKASKHADLQQEGQEQSRPFLFPSLRFMLPDTVAQ